MSPAAAPQRQRHDSGSGQQINMLWCHLFLDESMLQPGFHLSKKLIGSGGVNMKKIFKATGVKILLRGRGSGHEEAGSRGEPVHLMLAVTAEIGQEDKFLVALEMAAELIQEISGKYREFCKKSGLPNPTKPLFWIGEHAENTIACMGARSQVVMLGLVPVTMLLESAMSRGPKHC